MTTEQKRLGRRPNDPEDQGFLDNSIHLLLVEKLPEAYVRANPFGNESVIDTKRLSKDMMVSRQTVYRFLKAEKLSPFIALKLVKVSDGGLAEADLLPYLMRL